MALTGLHADWRNSSYLALGIFFLLAIAGNIHADSFDCGKAASEVERIICGDVELSKADESLNEAYRDALERAKKQVIDSQREWLQELRSACQNAECIKKAYETRINELDWFIVPRTAAPAEPVSGTYSSAHFIQDMEETYGLAESKMILSMKDKNTFEFDVTIFGGNFHTCDLSGVAVRRGRGFFEYRGTKPLFASPDECVLGFTFHGNFVRLNPKPGTCRAPCGQRAMFDGAVLYRSGAIRKASSKANPDARKPPSVVHRER